MSQTPAPGTSVPPARFFKRPMAWIITGLVMIALALFVCAGGSYNWIFDVAAVDPVVADEADNVVDSEVTIVGVACDSPGVQIATEYTGVSLNYGDTRRLLFGNTRCVEVEQADGSKVARMYPARGADAPAEGAAGKPLSQLCIEAQINVAKLTVGEIRGDAGDEAYAKIVETCPATHYTPFECIESSTGACSFHPDVLELVAVQEEKAKEKSAKDDSDKAEPVKPGDPTPTRVVHTAEDEAA